MFPAKRVLKVGLVTAALSSTAISLRANDYSLNSIGVIRFGRAAFTVRMTFPILELFCVI